MVRYSLIVLAGLYAAAPALASSWADTLFDGFSKDFGSVPRGPSLNHPFRLTNNTDSTVHIAGVRVSCGCVTATPTPSELAPGQTGAILVQMDTRRFFGQKTVTIYVTFDRPHYEEVRLWVQANSRDDVSLSPDSLSFGRVKRGSSPTVGTTVTFVGSGRWRILDARSESNYVQLSVVELGRDMNSAAYQVSARICQDAPVGKWYSDVWLLTNNPVSARVRVPLTVEIESALSAAPTAVFLGRIPAGGEAEQKVIVRGVKPFRITGVQGADGQLIVRDSTPGSKTVHVLTVGVKAKEPGDMVKTLHVLTDLDEDGAIDIQARAEILP